VEREQEDPPIVPSAGAIYPLNPAALDALKEISLTVEDFAPAEVLPHAPPKTAGLGELLAHR
jgi:hypothetical protein